MKLEQVTLREIRIRLRAPFETSFGCIQDRRILLVEVYSEGLSGWAECTAMETPSFNSETIDVGWLMLREYLIPLVLDKDIASARDLPGLFKPIRGNEMAKAALENAVWHLDSLMRGVPLHRLLGGTLNEISCGVSLGIQPTIDKLLALVDREVSAGYQRIKLKIKPGKDVEFVREVRRRFPRIKLSVDANSAYTLSDVDHLKKLDEFQLLMMEQPLDWDDIYEHSRLQAQIDTDICLDESIHNLRHASAAVEMDACRVVNIKLGRVGGHTEAGRIHSGVLRCARNPSLVRRHDRVGHWARPQHHHVHTSGLCLAWGRLCQPALLGRRHHRTRSAGYFARIDSCTADARSRISNPRASHRGPYRQARELQPIRSGFRRLGKHTE